MKPMFEICRWGNAYASGYEYRFLWGYLIVEYEYTRGTTKRPWLPHYIKQFGGDCLFLWGFGCFRRSVYITIWEFDQ